MSPVIFRSMLAAEFEQFVSLKRACGAQYATQARLLAQFDSYLVANKKRHIDCAVLHQFVASVDHLTARGRDNLFCVVWQALEHARRHNGPVAGFLSRPFIPRQPRRRPYVLTDAEIAHLFLTSSRRAYHAPPLCSATYVALFGLLLTTGLRSGEAVALNVQDMDIRNEVLLVREGKFHKERLVPVAGSTIAAIQKYLRQRLRHGVAATPTGPLFVTRTGQRFSVGIVWNTFRRIVTRAGIHDHMGRQPRVHDLRHNFALRRVIAWHNEGRDVNQLLSLLSTYMGHIGIKSTQVYLQPTVELLAVAGKRFETAFAAAISGAGRKCA